MNYRKMPVSGDSLSLLGFGCMRFPLDPEGKIDRDKSEEMLKRAIEGGVNYIDTAWPYHEGESEPFVGEFLEKNSLRDSIRLATKLPSWLIKSPKDMDHYLNLQLERLKTDRIDYYLVHALNRDYWNNLKNNGIFDFLDSLKKDPRVKNIGFSFHDNLELFREIVDSYSWDFCQIQYNYLDTEYQAGQAGLEYAVEKGLGVIVMEPLRGGKIAGRHPIEIEDIFTSLPGPCSSAAWALRWIYDSQGVVTVLSGMSTMEQLEENLKTTADYGSSSLTPDQRYAFKKIRDIYLSKIKAHCTECLYCMPCPVGVAIPRVLRFYNEAFIFEDIEKSSSEYHRFIGEDSRADKCIECGKCEKLCPQNIEIIKHLKSAAELFSR